MKKITGVIIGCMIVFAAGFYSFGKTGFLTDKRRDSFMMECNNARNNWVMESDLTVEDAVFLRQHLFGKWRFFKRILALRSSEEYFDDSSNFSVRGVEEIKKVSIIFDAKSVSKEGYDQNTFSKGKDIELFTGYDTYTEVNMPVYHVDRDVKADEIYLSCGIYGEHVQFPIACEIVAVYYSLGYNINDNPAVLGSGFYIYVNTEDTDTIYLDFCGLWELKRVNAD